MTPTNGRAKCEWCEYLRSQGATEEYIAEQHADFQVAADRVRSRYRAVLDKLRDM